MLVAVGNEKGELSYALNADAGNLAGCYCLSAASTYPKGSKRSCYDKPQILYSTGCGTHVQERTAQGYKRGGTLGVGRGGTTSVLKS